MYLDHTPSHFRFAAYELGYDPAVAADQQSRNDALRTQIEQEYGLKREELSNRMAIARMQSGDSRASTAAQASAERAKLKLATRQLEELGIPELELKRWVAQKNNELARATLGLDILKTGVSYASSPDQYWMSKDFNAAVPGLVNGTLRQPTNAPGGQPTPNNLTDLVAQYGLGSMMSGASGGTPPGSQASMDGQQGGTIRTQDAAQAVVGANPPSPFAGYSEGDQAALKSIGAIYKAGLDPYALDALNPTQAGILSGGGKRLGYDVPTEVFRANNKRVAQGSARAA